MLVHSCRQASAAYRQSNAADKAQRHQTPPTAYNGSLGRLLATDKSCAEGKETAVVTFLTGIPKTLWRLKRNQGYENGCVRIKGNKQNTWGFSRLLSSRARKKHTILLTKKPSRKREKYVSRPPGNQGRPCSTSSDILLSGDALGSIYDVPSRKVDRLTGIGRSLIIQLKASNETTRFLCFAR